MEEEISSMTQKIKEIKLRCETAGYKEKAQYYTKDIKQLLQWIDHLESIYTVWYDNKPKKVSTNPFDDILAICMANGASIGPYMAQAG